MSYVTSVGGDPINPLIYTYSSISITSDIAMVWPSNNQNATYTATDWVDITSSAAYTVTMPPANEAGTGDETVFFNYGSFTVTINDSTGGNITTVASGLTKRIWITDNSTAAGTWKIANIGSGTTNADASALAGYGIIAQSGLLSQSMPPSAIGTSTTINAGYRAYLVIWTGGSGTITLPSAITSGANWFVNVKNAGSGTLTINGGGTNIDTSSTVSVAVNEGFTIASNGSVYYTIGRLTPNTSAITLLNKSVTGSTDITLSASESVYNIINYTGTLGASFGIIVPSSVNQWIMSNSATGSTYHLTIKTSGGTGVTLSQGATREVYSDASDVFFSESASASGVTSVATGTGLSGGPITTTGTISLANTAVSAGGYNVPALTIDAQGRITAASNATTVQTSTSSGSTFTLQAYDTDGTVYATMATMTAGVTPSMDLATSVTIGSAYIYRIGGTDVSVGDGGTGTSSLTANNVILGNGTSAVQFVSPSGTGNVLTATGTTWTSSASPSPSAATQAQMEGGTDLTVFASPGRIQYHPGVAKAWVNFAGASGNINASYNVSSVTHSGTGKYVVNFTTAFSSASYCVTGLSTDDPAVNAVSVNFDSSVPSSSTTCALIVRKGGGLAFDAAAVCASFFGDQ